MRPVTEVQQETAELLGEAVAEVTRRAIRPELQPFEGALSAAASRLEGSVEELDGTLAGMGGVLDRVNRQVAESITHQERLDGVLDQVQEAIDRIREGLERTGTDLAALSGHVVRLHQKQSTIRHLVLASLLMLTVSVAIGGSVLWLLIR